MFIVIFFGGIYGRIDIVFYELCPDIFYQILIIVPAKKRANNKKNEKELLEVKYLEIVHKVDIQKVKYEQLIQICAIVSSLDISLAVTFVCMVDGLLLELLVGFLSIIVLIVVSYYLIYLFYKKKGMIKSGKHK